MALALADEQRTIYDVADDPFFGRPKCLIFDGELCLTECEFGIRGDCARRQSERAEDE